MTKRLNHTIFSTFLDLLEIFGFVRRVESAIT
jgi:hypothetical protein